ncbi:substrate-binding periplasmic protein [Candidatus Methylobacter oryzae]|uniref:Amino acid ABC transporter substrate-binding protein n=1 Tax=Candidatus Methylobacter oryzae TaxID=2497749 RepID=A0ABY3C6C5_9GAMM|nr:transporter substrate-binding domain-containing protein [Candidatus Methylobacter oryzae]TRW90364.1 amino acid ABC transporter substrate-binding protein [Candidatus Methylobacter oryzae]
MNKAKKIISITLVYLITFFISPSLVLANEQLVANEPANEIQAIIKRGKLIVAMYSQDTPPFYYIDKNNELTGVDVVLIKGFADLLGVSVEFDRSAKFLDDVVEKVEKHQADLAICKLSVTFGRAQRVLFAEPYVNLHQSLLINRLELSRQLKGRSQEETIQNLAGKIGVVAKSSYVTYAKHFENMEIVQYPTWNEVVDHVVQGDITAAFRDDAEVKMILRDRPDTALHLLSVVLKDAKDPKGIALSLDHRNLKDLLDFYLKSLDLNLSADKIINDYDNVIKIIQIKAKHKV